VSTHQPVQGDLQRAHQDVDVDRLRKIARATLRRADAIGQIPTPLDDIRRAQSLRTVTEIEATAAEAPAGVREGWRRAKTRILGFVAPRDRLVYIDPGLSHARGRFTLGHEIGHDAIPWQSASYRFDDASSLAPDVRDHFEREAHGFSAELLFNLNSFTDEAHSSPLSLAVPLSLASRYDVSAHAALHRYVEESPRECALLVVGRYPVHPAGSPGIKVLAGLQSKSFLERHGSVGAHLPGPFVRRDINPWAEAAWQAMYGTQPEPVLTGRCDIGQLGIVDFEAFSARLSFVLIRPVRLRRSRSVHALWVPESAA
jgi:hypothetical protein